MTVALSPIKPILRVSDICDLLGISRTEFYRLKAEGWFDRLGLLVEVLPRVNAREPRYSGAPFVAWLSDRRQRAEIEKVEAIA